MHCKDISMRDVDFPLTEKNISETLSKWNAYVRTEYIVLRNKEELAVVKINKEKSDSLFRKVSSVEIVSLPENTVFVRDHEVDVLNISDLASVQERYPEKSVVIEGMFSYISFVSELKTVKLRVIDNIPPGPSRLRILVGRALSSGLVEHPIIPKYEDNDLEKKIKYVKTEAVMFPCEVSGMKADIPFYFLDKSPELEHDVTLIGCGLSNRIFHALYGRDVPFINVCPLDAVPNDGMKTIVRCCTVKEGYEIEGNTAKVPWGATVAETINAINALFQNSE